MMAEMGQPMSSQELKEFIEEIDIDGNGSIEFNEFLEMMVKKNPEAVHGASERNRADDVAIAFKVTTNHATLSDHPFLTWKAWNVWALKVFDRDADGFVTKAELMHVLMSLGENLTEDDVAEIIDEGDKDRDGKLSYQEFRNLLQMKTSELDLPP